MTSWLYWLCMIIWLAFSIVFFTLLSKTPPPPPRSHLRTKNKQSSLLEIRIGCVNEQFKSVISQNPKSSVSLICFVANKWSKKETYLINMVYDSPPPWCAPHVVGVFACWFKEEVCRCASPQRLQLKCEERCTKSDTSVISSHTRRSLLLPPLSFEHR